MDYRIINIKKEQLELPVEWICTDKFQETYWDYNNQCIFIPTYRRKEVYFIFNTEQLTKEKISDKRDYLIGVDYIKIESIEQLKEKLKEYEDRN